MTGCVGRRYLKDDEKILVNQKLIGASNLDKEELKSLYEYRPNDRILFFPWSPYVDLYQVGKSNFDSMKYVRKIEATNEKYQAKIAAAEGKEKKQTKLKEKLGKKVDKQNRNIREGNFAMRLGEPLAVYDTALESETLDNIEKYLHSKGYFNAEVTYTSEEQFSLMTSTYFIDKKEPYKVDSIFYEVQDTLIANILKNDRPNSRIQTDVNYEQGSLVEERDRIHELMRNNGYYAFSRRYVNYVVDTASRGDKKVIVGISVTNPSNKNAHKIYKIDSINFVTDADQNDQTQPRIFADYKGITYLYHTRRYSEKILDWRVFLNKDSVFRRDNTRETQKQLANMDIFRFINVSYDTTGGLFIANIHTSPLSKFQTSSELGLNVSKGLPGPFFNASIKNRNTFHGLEIMELSGRVGFEGLSGASDTGDPYTSLDYGANLSFTFPQFMFPLGQDIKSQLGRLNPKTRVSFDLNFNYRPEYQRNTINSSLNYSWINYKKHINHIFSLADINFIDSEITDPNYQAFLEDLRDQGNNLINSFNSAYVSSIWYSAIYNFNDYGNKKAPSSYLRYKIETGGNTSNLYNNLASDNGIETYKYAKFNLDFRRNIPLGPNVSFAYRVNTGVALPYGDNKTLPYEKFYFAGGSNSIRAWEPRRLGAGAYLPIDTVGNYNNRYEEPGEILFESSMELRHKLFGFVYGAIFVDAGNIWKLREDPVRPGAKFEFGNFFSELAVGAGYGIRLDLSFLLLRLDAAWKIIDPGTFYRDAAGTTIEDQRDTFEVPDFPGYNRLVWNLGIGYPF